MLQTARRLVRVDRHGMPGKRLRPRAVVASHMLRKSLRNASADPRQVFQNLRILVAESVFFELTRQNFGFFSMLRGRHGFFPHIFMPEYHGPHFEEALQRLSVPGRGPNIMYFSLTGSCPCHCEYCFAGAGGEDAPDVGDEAVLQVAREVAALKVPVVNLSGGEPLSRYKRLLDTIRALDQGSEVRMFTTGVGLTPARVTELHDAGLTGVFVSLDTIDANAFDQARRYEGAFAAAVNALRLFAEADFLTFINCVVDKTRFLTEDEVEQFLDFVADIDPRIVVNFLPQLSTGRGTEAASFRHPEECEEVAERIYTVAERLNRPIGMLFGNVDRFIGCPGAGGKLMNIDIEGNVTVCVSKASLGNLLEEPFPVIYQRWVAHCNRLAVGFFCCEVAEETEGELMPPEDVGRMLSGFYRDKDRASFQAIYDNLGWAMDLLFVGSGDSEAAA